MTVEPGLIVVEPDPRSYGYLIEDHLEVSTEPKRIIWPAGPYLNQGQTGACVGFSYACEAIAEPFGDLSVTTKQGNDLGYLIWRRAKSYWGAHLHDDSKGTTMERGAQASVELGIFDSYLWGKSIDDLRTAVQHGPVLIAVRWWRSLGSVDRYGNFKLNRNSTEPDSAHAMCVIGFDPEKKFSYGKWRKKKFTTEPGYLIRNSWGGRWAYRIKRVKNKRGRWTWRFVKHSGQAWIRERDLDWLAKDYYNYLGVCLPQGRKPVDVGAILEANPEGY